MMIVVCAWCGKVLEEKKEGYGVSHSICEECFENMKKEMEGEEELGNS